MAGYAFGTSLSIGYDDRNLVSLTLIILKERFMTATMPMTNNSKKPYASPRLVAFGNVHSITQSGASPMMENTSFMGRLP
jgi:hypothetical protein